MLGQSPAEMRKSRLQSLYGSFTPKVASVRAAGYLYVTLDLVGYRTGSLNEALLRKRAE